MTTSLEKLFGSHYRVKLIRFFLLNPTAVFPQKIVGERLKIPAPILHRELNALQQAGFIRHGSVMFPNSPAGGRAAGEKRRRVRGSALQTSFPLLQELKHLVLSSSPISLRQLAETIKRTGRIKLITVSGVFLKADTRLDLLVVGEHIKKGAFAKALRNIEAEIGKELAYAQLSTDEFKYRLGMYDRFIREVLEHPHEHIVNKLDVA